MKKRGFFAACLGVAATAGAFGAFEREASACGGCVLPPPPPTVTENESVITDEQMIFSISQEQTTLYDEIEYSGSPSEFGWILPIRGTVTVGLSADVLFQTINALTATTVIAPSPDCPPPPSCGGGGSGCQFGFGGASVGDDALDGSIDGEAEAVTVKGQSQVGPYETVQLQSSDGSALTSWLSSHGYVVPASDKAAISSYVAAGFDFLALRLLPGKGVQAMRPVRVTSKGASVSLPLHMVSVGTGATTGITIYVIADGRWEPQNFPTFTIGDGELAWDWATNSSNYETLRLSKEASLGGRGWQIESSLDVGQYAIVGSLGSAIQSNASGTGGYASPNDAGAQDSGARGAKDTDAESTDAGKGPDSAAADPGKEYGLGAAADADLAMLFTGIAGSNVRITRMRSDIAHAALDVDMYLQASSDQGELTNRHTPTKEIGQPECSVYDDNCNVVGAAPRDQVEARTHGGCNTSPREGLSRTALALFLCVSAILGLRLRERR